MKQLKVFPDGTEMDNWFYEMDMPNIEKFSSYYIITIMGFMITEEFTIDAY